MLQFRDAKTKEILKSETVKGNEVEIDDLLTGITYLMTVSALGEGGVQGQASDPQMVITCRLHQIWAENICICKL